MVKRVPLTSGRYALVDAADYEDVMQFKWQALVGRWNVYAYRSVLVAGTVKWEYMHRRLIPGAAYVDHRNHDGLDNRRANLRTATNSQNMSNRRGANANNTSGYLGVSWHGQRGKWRAHIKLDGRQVHLGLFSSAEEAAKARDAGARKYFGEFASLNFPEIEQRCA